MLFCNSSDGELKWSAIRRHSKVDKDRIPDLLRRYAASETNSDNERTPIMMMIHSLGDDFILQRICVFWRSSYLRARITAVFVSSQGHSPSQSDPLFWQCSAFLESSFGQIAGSLLKDLRQ